MQHNINIWNFEYVLYHNKWKYKKQHILSYIPTIDEV